ncbi:MAG: dUTP diphosphatase [Marinomonas sp.]
MTKIYIEQISETASPIKKGTRDSACFDLCADLHNIISIDLVKGGVGVYRNENGDKIEELKIKPKTRMLIPTGYKMCCDTGYCIEIYPRSGASFKKGLTLNNCVGVIDADYRGEVMISIVNNSNQIQTIKHGDPIAQMRLAKLENEELIFGELPVTTSDRNGGFGSTDKESK